VPIGPSETRQAATLLLAFVDAGYSVKEVASCLTLMWHEVPLFTASVWRGAPMSTAAAGIVDGRAEGKKISGHQEPVASGGIAMQ
jgi:hypothetical protein